MIERWSRLTWLPTWSQPVPGFLFLYCDIFCSLTRHMMRCKLNLQHGRKSQSILQTHLPTAHSNGSFHFWNSTPFVGKHWLLMASQLFEKENKIGTISGHNIQVIFKLVSVPLVLLRALPFGVNVLCKSLLQLFLNILSTLIWKAEVASFVFDCCMAKPHSNRLKVTFYWKKKWKKR